MNSFLKSNNLARLIAFVLAVMLWLVVRAGSEAPSGATAPIDRVTETISGTAEVLLNTERVSLVGDAPGVTVRLQGERLSVWQAKMQVTKLKFIADARNLSEGVHEVPVRVEGLPPGIIQDPLNVSIRLEANKRLSYKVDLVTEANTDADKLAGVRTEPQEVAVVGPSSLLQQVQKVQVRVPAQAFEAPGVRQTVVVYAVNEKGRTMNVTIQPKTVDLVYEPVLQRKEFTKLQPQIKGVSQGKKVQLPADGFTVTLEGKVMDLEAIKPEDIAIVVDVTGLAPGNYVRDATVSVPATVKVADKEPLRIPVKIIAE